MLTARSIDGREDPGTDSKIVVKAAGGTVRLIPGLQSPARIKVIALEQRASEAGSILHHQLVACAERSAYAYSTWPSGNRARLGNVQDIPVSQQGVPSPGDSSP